MAIEEDSLLCSSKQGDGTSQVREGADPWQGDHLYAEFLYPVWSFMKEAAQGGLADLFPHINQDLAQDERR